MENVLRQSTITDNPSELVSDYARNMAFDNQASVGSDEGMWVLGAMERAMQNQGLGGIEPQSMSSTNLGTPQQMFAGGTQGGIMATGGNVTQRFGNYNPSLYRGVNKSMTNTGTDFGIPSGTPLAAPPGGKWLVAEAFGNSPDKPNRNANRGYGNSVLLINTNTGEKLRFSHLSQVGVKPGQIVEGGNAFGLSGKSGNATGPHLDLEYYDPKGRLRDVLNSPYARYL